MRPDARAFTKPVRTKRRVASVAAAAVAFGALDAVWISQFALPLYRAQVPHLLAESFEAAPALVFYPAFTLGLVHLAVRPDEERTLGARVRDGAVFGGVAYATWSLTGKAILKDLTWPVALADLGWGLAVGAAMAAAAHLVMRTRWAGRRG